MSTTTKITLDFVDVSDEDRALIDSLTPAEFERARQAALGHAEMCLTRIARAKATEIRARHTASADPMTAATTIRRDTDVEGILWPWAEANRVLNPMTPGQLVLLAGRPGVGKSVALLEIARHAALHQGRTVILHSLEMPAGEVMLRILSAEARVPLMHLQDQELSDEERERVDSAQTRLDDAPLHVIDSPEVDIDDIQESITRYTPDLLLVDYLQLCQVDQFVERRQGLEELTRALKLTARVSGIPIVAAAQLGQESDLRSDHYPELSDLHGLENDADVVVLMSRPDYYDPESARAGEVDMIVEKQRNGPTGTVTLIHQLHYARIIDPAGAFAETTNTGVIPQR